MRHLSTFILSQHIRPLPPSFPSPSHVQIYCHQRITILINKYYIYVIWMLR